MATITGLRLSDLSFLPLGTTGTLFYVVDGGAQYKMSESGLFNTLSGLHLNRYYQPKSEDSRFVHTTGIDLITGAKAFYGTSMFQPGPSDSFSINNSNGVNALYLDNNGNFYVQDTAGQQALDVNGRLLYADDGSLAMSWNTFELLNAWTVNQLDAGVLRLNGIPVYTSDNPSGYITFDNAVFTTGDQEISNTKSFHNVQVYDTFSLRSSVSLAEALRYESDTFQPTLLRMYDTNGLSIDVLERGLFDADQNLSLDWGNRVLTGNWTVDSLNIVGGGAGFYPLNSNPSGYVPSVGGIIYDQFGKAAILLSNRILLNGNDAFYNSVMWWASGQLLSGFGNIKLDWFRNILSGVWSATDIKVSGKSLITGIDSGAFLTNTLPLNGLSPSGLSGYNVDFLKTYQQILTPSGLNFSGISNATGVRNVSIYIPATGIDRGVAFNTGWIFLGTAPTVISSGKAAVLSLTSFGTLNANVVVAYGTQG